MKLTQVADIKYIITNNQLTSIIIETGDENVFIPEENKFILKKNFLLASENLFLHCKTLKK